MNRIEKIFNELIQIKLVPQFGGILRYVELRYRNPYRYDLIFEFNREYNNPNIKLASVLHTCDELFKWVDIKNVVSIVIVTDNKPKHYSYFELFEQVYLGNYFNRPSYFDSNELKNHQYYNEYLVWKEEKVYREKMDRDWRMSMENLERRDYEQQKMVPQKKKFLFW